MPQRIRHRAQCAEPPAAVHCRQILHLLVKAPMPIVHTGNSAACCTPHDFPRTCNSPPHIPHSRADTASLRPVPMVATIRSPATSAQSRPRTPNCRVGRQGSGFAHGKVFRIAVHSRLEVSAAQYKAAPAHGRHRLSPPDSSHAAALVSNRSCTACAAPHAAAAVAQVLRERMKTQTDCWESTQGGNAGPQLT